MAFRDPLAAAQARIASLERELEESQRELAELRGQLVFQSAMHQSELGRVETEKDVAEVHLHSERRSAEGRERVLAVLKEKVGELEAELARERSGG